MAMIRVRNLTKTYGTLAAVRDVSFDVRQGDIVGLLGPNGAGKTTIMKVLTCYLFPSRGTAEVNGSDVVERPLDVKRCVGYLPENAPLYMDLNVSEYLSFIADARGLEGPRRRERLEWVIGECGLSGVLYRTIDTLSKGYRQRTGLAQAMLHDPAILILDEPTTGLDPHQIIEIRELIKRLGKEKTVILSTHILQEVEATCHSVLILNEGRIVAQGTKEEIERELKGELRVDLTVKAPDLPKVEAAAVRLPAGARLVALKAVGPGAGTHPQGAFAVRVSLPPGEGAEEAIFDWAVGEGYKILAMVPERLSLEDIFIKLTQEGGMRP
jgi:ABC-2 type transport system ATP-binding protein